MDRKLYKYLNKNIILQIFSVKVEFRQKNKYIDININKGCFDIQGIAIRTYKQIDSLKLGYIEIYRYIDKKGTKVDSKIDRQIEIHGMF